MIQGDTAFLFVLAVLTVAWSEPLYGSQDFPGFVVASAHAQDLSVAKDGSFEIVEETLVHEQAGVATKIRIEYGVFSTFEGALRAWTWALRSNGYGVQILNDDPLLGDVYTQRSPYGGSFLESGVVVKYQIEVGSSSEEFQDLEGFYDRVHRALVAGAKERGPLLLEEFRVSYTVVSAEMPISLLGEVVSTSPFESGYRYSVWDTSTNEEVLSRDWKEFDSSRFEVVVDSISPGEYRLVISTTDALGRNANFVYNFEVLPIDSSGIVNVECSGDSTLQHRNPHQNEGISPYLTLEKIQGKATRSAVAFDLSDVNLTGLTSATLRLTVDPSQGVNGWGNGDTISALPLSTGWVEGNGQSFGLKKKDQVAGSGSGVTWFSPVDSDISNDYANSTVQWNGGTTGTPTSPLIVMQNHYTGTVDFDVTNDLLNGQGLNGWLLKKDQENRGSKVTFYSREGAAAAGNTDLAPTLILNYGSPTASTNSPGSNLLARLGWNSGPSNLKPTNPSSELKNLKQALKDNSTAALVGDQLLQNATRANPPLHIATAIAYRVWLG